MRIIVIPTRWDEVVQEFVPIPLDDADRVTIELARRCNGKEMTEQQFDRVVNELLATDSHRPS